VADAITRLTNREHEIAELIADGQTNREIAERLYLSIRTVETHVSHTLEKLGVPNRAAIAALTGAGAVSHRPATTSNKGGTRVHTEAGGFVP
jgi:DNA-binding NarL/FixJ family response regulator